MGLPFSKPVLSEEEIRLCHSLYEELSAAWKKSLDLDRMIVAHIFREVSINEKRRVTSQKPLPPNLRAAEIRVVNYLENLHSLISAERYDVEKLGPRYPVSVLFSEKDFRSLFPKHRQERGLLRFVARYTRRAGDGIRGCWGERMMQVVEDLEMMSADELVEFVESRQDEMESVLEELTEMLTIEKEQ